MLLVKVYHHHHEPVDHQSLTVHMNLSLLFHSWSLCICIWRGSYSEGMPSLPSSLIPLLVFSDPNSRMSFCCITLRPELPRIADEHLQKHLNRPESIKIQYTMPQNALQTFYEFATNFLNREFVAEILNSSKLCPRIPDWPKNCKKGLQLQHSLKNFTN